MPTAPTDDASTSDQERRELVSLLWFFWAGILIASLGETALVLLMDSSATGASTGLANYHTLVVALLAGLMWSAIALVYRTRFGGGGFPTAIICWMLAKGTVILGFVMYFLEPGWGYTWVLFGAFLTIMAVLRPTKFVAPSAPP
jgi:hypothetical protein